MNSVTQLVELTEEYDSTREDTKHIPILQEATMKWLGQYEKGRLEMHLDFPDLKDSRPNNY